MSNQTFEGLPKPPGFMQVPSENGLFRSPLTMCGDTQIGGTDFKIIEIHIYPAPPYETKTPAFTGKEWTITRPVSQGPHYIHTRMYFGGQVGDWHDTGWFYVLTPPE